jgi:L-gulono-1,4-lactone dehydrogenase
MSPLWRNWAGDQRCAPHRIERPANEDELVAAVGRAAEEGLPLRAAGSGHSFNDLVCTDGVLVDLREMNRVLDADTATGQVRVQAGITLSALGAELAERGLAMENQGDVDMQGLAGAITTATHGTGARFGNLSAQVHSLRLVTAAGDAIEVSEDADRELWLAARVGLGALGVISELTLRCVPLFTVHRVDEPRPLEETLAHIDEHVDGNDHFEMFVFPYTQTALTLTSERTDDYPVGLSWRRRFQENQLENTVLSLSCRLGRRFPSLIPRLNRALVGLASRSEKTDRSHRVYANRRDVRFTEMEYAIPRDAVPVALERVLDLIARRELPIPFPIEVRFVAHDDAFLSPAHERETGYIAVHQFAGMEFESYFRGVEEIMDDYGGRPHWGKRHYQSQATLRPRYPEWDRFQAVRERLDPEGVFANDYTRRVLGVGTPAPA